jgi:hypothetical protein
VDGTRTREGPRNYPRFSGNAQEEGPNGRESSPFAPIRDPLSQRDLEAAIASVTRALATATGEAVAILVSERAVLRAELASILSSPNVVALTA